MLPNLRTFYLGRNFFSYIDEDYFSKIPNLNYLDISDTGTNALPDVSVLTSLRSLYASNNNLKFVSTEQLKGLPRLSSISLYYNYDLNQIPNFLEVAQSTLASTLYVSLYGTSLHCGSDLCWLKEISQRYMFSVQTCFIFNLSFLLEKDCYKNLK